MLTQVYKLMFFLLFFRCVVWYGFCSHFGRVWSHFGSHFRSFFVTFFDQKSSLFFDRFFIDFWMDFGSLNPWKIAFFDSGTILEQKMMKTSSENGGKIALKINQKTDASFELKNVGFGGQNWSKMEQQWGQNELHKVPKRELNWEVSPGTPGGVQKEPTRAKKDPKWSSNGAKN